MARRRWYRRYPRVVAAKKKWATHLRSGQLVGLTRSDVLAENAPASTAGSPTVPTPVIMKTGNFKVQGDILLNTTTSGVGGSVSIVVYLVYVPEGMAVTNIVNLHPEYLMGWTVVDTPAVTTTFAGTNKFSLTSRLKRNLNSGDRIMLLYDPTTDIGTLSITVNYTAQFWTCSN